MVKNVLLFSGQGAHHLQMGRELYEHETEFRLTLQQVEDIARAISGESMLDAMYPAQWLASDPFDRLLHTHASIFAIEYALAKLLSDREVAVDAVIGASLGSFAAAVVAGALDLESALSAVIAQARLIEARAEVGCMVAVLAAPYRFMTPELEALCEVASINFDGHSVIALPANHWGRVQQLLTAADVTFQPLPVRAAFHSRWIDPAAEACRTSLRALSMRPTKAPMICCVTGDVMRDLPVDYFWTAVREPVVLGQAIARVEAQGDVRYIDVSPSGSMAGFVRRLVRGRADGRVHSILSPASGDRERLAAVLALRAPSRSIIRNDRDGDVARPATKERPMKSDRSCAVLFPGQGSQFKGMGKSLFPHFRELTKTASDMLGYSLEELCVEDPRNQLGQTQYTQPALYVVNAMHFMHRYGVDADDPARSEIAFYAGHSLGEYNALHAAGVFSFETGLQLVRKRGELMASATGGGMAAIVGVRSEVLRQQLSDLGMEAIDVANFNTPTQTVIAGEREALNAAMAVLGERGLRCVPLNVSAAFHSRHMRVLQQAFASFLRGFEFASPRKPVIANATALPYAHEHVAHMLATQFASPVQWVDSIRYLMGRDVQAFEEMGASVLTRMVAEIRATESPIAKADVEVAQATPLAITPEAVQSVPASGPHIDATSLGSETFRRRYGLRYAYLAGAMYRGVASAELVIRMGKAGFLSFFGAGGLSPERIEASLLRIKQALVDDEPYGMNLLANHEYPEMEAAVVDLYLRHAVKHVEAAAFMQMTPALVRFRLRGLSLDPQGNVVCSHRIIAKVSRPEVAHAFMSPAPAAVVRALLEGGLITAEQAEWSRRVPVSHDICVEADSGGHTDGGIAAVMLPPMLRLRDRLQQEHGYTESICMGLAGGIGGPEAAAAAFLLGADFVMTGSVNQCTVEAGMSADGKAMLQQMDIQDTEYAPAGDMFEIGAQVQVMKKSVFFPARANKLLSIYRHYDSLDDIPPRTRQQLEGTFFRKTFEEIWQETVGYFRSIKLDHEIVKAQANAKHKMALVFRWYFAYCTRIAMEGKGDDRVNYQIQTGPALGSFNQWVKGTELESWEQRHVDQIALKIMHATAEHLTQSFARFAAR